MTLHLLGSRLRDQVLTDRLQGRGIDPRRLQAVVADLCGETHADLVAPLRYLVLSTPFASAAAQDPPLADGRLLQRLNAELAQMFAAPVCQRLQPVLEGLLGLPEQAGPGHAGQAAGAAATLGNPGGGRPAAAPPWPDATAAGPADMAGSWPPQQTAPPQPQVIVTRSGGTALNVVLAFVSGVLLMLLAAVGLVLWQRQQSQSSADTTTSPARREPLRPSPTAAPPPVAASPQPAAATPPADHPETVVPEPTATTGTPLDRAVSGIQDLYNALSAKDFAQARALFAPGAADQFDEGFFRQFQRVSVQNLRSLSETGSTVNLEGEVTFVWPDGSTQTESRSFSVDTSSDPALITGSEFGRVIRPR